MSLSNGQIYRKTFVFSWLRLLLDLLAFIVMVACIALGYLILQDKIIGIIGGLIIGIVIFWIIIHFFGYLLKAGQIAMMTRGIVEGELPDNIVAEGKAEVKSRFATVSAYYLISSAIHGIFHEITSGINALSKAGGSTGEEVGDAVNSVINIAVEYLCDCCLGWIFYKKSQGAFKGTCQGAVLFFKNWKALLKNMGRVFGLGIASFVVIGGALTAGFYFLLGNFPDFVNAIAQGLQSADSNLGDLSDPAVALIFISVVFGIICWLILHAVFVRPFVLVGVLRNYLQAGIAKEPNEENFAELDQMSSKFRNVHEKASAEA